MVQRNNQTIYIVINEKKFLYFYHNKNCSSREISEQFIIHIRKSELGSIQGKGTQVVGNSVLSSQHIEL